MTDTPIDSLEDPIFRPCWPDGLEPVTVYQIHCDDRGVDAKVWLRVMVAEDGDTYVSMMDWEDCPEGHPSPFPAVRVRTLHGGGRNMRTRQALLWLAQAIRLDNIENRSDCEEEAE